MNRQTYVYNSIQRLNNRHSPVTMPGFISPIQQQQQHQTVQARKDSLFVRQLSILERQYVHSVDQLFDTRGVDDQSPIIIGLDAAYNKIHDGIDTTMMMKDFLMDVYETRERHAQHILSIIDMHNNKYKLNQRRNAECNMMIDQLCKPMLETTRDLIVYDLQMCRRLQVVLDEELTPFLNESLKLCRSIKMEMDAINAQLYDERCQLKKARRQCIVAWKKLESFIGKAKKHDDITKQLVITHKSFAVLESMCDTANVREQAYLMNNAAAHLSMLETIELKRLGHVRSLCDVYCKLIKDNSAAIQRFNDELNIPISCESEDITQLEVWVQSTHNSLMTRMNCKQIPLLAGLPCKAAQLCKLDDDLLEKLQTNVQDLIDSSIRNQLERHEIVQLEIDETHSVRLYRAMALHKGDETIGKIHVEQGAIVRILDDIDANSFRGYVIESPSSPVGILFKSDFIVEQPSRAMNLCQMLEYPVLGRLFDEYLNDDQQSMFDALRDIAQVLRQQRICTRSYAYELDQVLSIVHKHGPDRYNDMPNDLKDSWNSVKLELIAGMHSAQALSRVITIISERLEESYSKFKRTSAYLSHVNQIEMAIGSKL